jgi:hypothetical protein
MKTQYRHWRDIPQDVKPRPTPKPFRLLASVWADPSRMTLAAK